MLWEDTKGLARWSNAACLGAALAGSLAVRDELDEKVRENTARHPERWGEASRVLGRFGEPQYQVAALLALYGWSLHRQDDGPGGTADARSIRDASATMISAFTLTGLATLAAKGIADTDRPSEEWNGGRWGFPSYHAASSFSLAAVLDEYYGPRAGLPAYAVAGLISFSRIDERDHDLSDVVFGAALGWVIGKSVAGRHLYGDSRVRILPWAHPREGGAGIALEARY